MKNAWKNDFDNKANKLYENCAICKILQKTPPQSAVVLTLANEFNSAFTIDLNY